MKQARSSCSIDPNRHERPFQHLLSSPPFGNEDLWCDQCSVGLPNRSLEKHRLSEAPKLSRPPTHDHLLNLQAAVDPDPLTPTLQTFQGLLRVPMPLRGGVVFPKPTHQADVHIAEPRRWRETQKPSIQEAVVSREARPLPCGGRLQLKKRHPTLEPNRVLFAELFSLI